MVIFSYIKALIKKKLGKINATIWTFTSSKKFQMEMKRGCLYDRYFAPFEGVSIPKQDPSIHRYFKHLLVKDFYKDFADEFHESFIELDRKSFIEPSVGWIITSPFQLIDNCLLDSPRRTRPSIKRFFKLKYFDKDKIIKEDAVIHFAVDCWVYNYYHFLFDVIGSKLRILESSQIDQNIPLVVSKELFKKKFFQDFLKRTKLGERRLLIQDNQLVECNKIFYFQPSFFNTDAINFIWDYLKVPDSSIDSKKNRRIFLLRDSSVGRNIINIDEIKKILDDLNFEFLDTSKLSLDEQIQVFGETRYVIGVHGAGLSNIIFRKRAKLSLLEIFPPMSYWNLPFPREHYFYLANSLGFQYDLFFGESNNTGNYSSPFSLNISLFSQKLKSFLEDYEQCKNSLSNLGQQ